MTIVRDVLTEAREALGRAAIDDPRREAMHLWAAATGQETGSAMLATDTDAGPAAVAAMQRLVERRVAGEPLAHVTGTMGFRHLMLRSDPRALIPRPETEGLVEIALQCTRSGVAADIGTGSGAIALALRQEGEYSDVFGVDISPDALALAAANASRVGLAVTWLEGDLLAPLAGRRLDLLVSNPPYLTEAEYLECDPSVRDYEPALALVSGADGMDAIRRLLADGRAVMAPGGWIALEVDTRRAQATAQLAEQHGWNEVAVLDDLFGRARYVRAQLRSSE